MKICLMLVLLLLVACMAPKPVYDNSTPAKLNEAEMQAISDSVCPAGQSLVQMPDSTSSLASMDRRAVAFANGTGDCALESDIDEGWPMPFGSPAFFRVIVDGCVPNNSVWKFKSGNIQDSGVNYIFTDVSGLHEIKVQGSGDISISYARSHAGLRTLDCQ